MDMTIANCETGEITVVPLSDEHLASLAEAAAQEEAERTRREAVAAQRQTDAETIMAVLPSQAAKDAMARLLGLS